MVLGKLQEGEMALEIRSVPPWTLEEASSDLGLMENYEGKSVIEVFIVEVFI